jgi:hypothetical protein
MFTSPLPTYNSELIIDENPNVKIINPAFTTTGDGYATLAILKIN